MATLLDQFSIGSWSGNVQQSTYDLVSGTTYTFEFYGNWTHRTNSPATYGVGDSIIYPGGYGSGGRHAFTDFFWRYAEVVAAPAGKSYPFLHYGDDTLRMGLGGSIKVISSYFYVAPAYTNTHKYLVKVTADGNGRAKFQFSDPNFTDNNGSIRISIYEFVASATTPSVRIGKRSDGGIGGAPLVQTNNAARSAQSSIRIPGKGATFV